MKSSLLIGIYAILIFLILSNCVIAKNYSSSPLIKSVDLLISVDDMPVGWKSFDIFSDEYDDLCYTDCAMIQFSPNGEYGVYSEQSIYAYNTIEEAERNYAKLLNMLFMNTVPHDDNFHSTVANQSEIYCHTHESKSYPNCIWVARYGKYLVEFYVAMLPNNISLNDLENIILRIDAKMKIVANQ